jgi:hypothetical protein
MRKRLETQTRLLEDRRAGHCESGSPPVWIGAAVLVVGLAGPAAADANEPFVTPEISTQQPLGGGMHRDRPPSRGSAAGLR